MALRFISKPARSETVVETASPLGANATYFGTPVDCTGGKLVVWRARTNVQGANPTMEAQESADGGSTWYPIIRPDGYSAIESTGQGFYTGRITAPSTRLVRLVFYNGGAAQASLEILRSVS